MIGQSGFVLEGSRTRVWPFLRSVASSWGLIAILARKDFFVRYRRTAFGLLWAVGLPLVQAAVIAVVFSRFVRFDVGSSYGTFVFGGVLPWSFVSGTVLLGATSIVDGEAMATKVYFPRVTFPLAVTVANMLTLLPGIIVLFGLAVVLGDGLGPSIVLIIPAVILAALFTASLAMLLSALHVYFRDIRFIVQATVMAWFYATPIIYPLEFIGGTLRRVIELNPATGIVGLFREATIGNPAPLTLSVLSTCAFTAVLLVGAVWIHSRRDRVFVDLL